MARVNYTNVRRHLGKRFSLSKSYTGRGGRANLSQGVSVRTSSIDGVVVDYTEGSTALHVNSSKRKETLADVRAYLEERYTVTEHWARDGRLIISEK